MYVAPRELAGDRRVLRTPFGLVGVETASRSCARSSGTQGAVVNGCSPCTFKFQSSVRPAQCSETGLEAELRVVLGGESRLDSVVSYDAPDWIIRPTGVTFSD